MDDAGVFGEAQARLARFLGFLETDPDNLQLLGDAVGVALEAGQPDTALELLERYAKVAVLPAALLNLKGLAALQQQRFGDAVAMFRSLLDGAPDDAGLKFNLAWALTMLGDDNAAAGLLDEATATALPCAAVLKIQALHRLGDLESAWNCGSRLAEAHPGDKGLTGALSLVAIDMRRLEEASALASRAGDTPDGLSTLGMLSLHAHKPEEARALFERGLALRPDSPRNLLGKGLTLLATGDARAAAIHIDRSAHLFERHLGTWIASGWAHFASGDRVRARAVFEHVLTLDDTFSESHGALAVLDMLEGDVAGARRRTETALRLDRRCFAGALAKSLLLEHDGDPQGAQRIRDITLNTPLESGQTLAEAMIAHASYWRKADDIGS